MRQSRIFVALAATTIQGPDICQVDECSIDSAETCHEYVVDEPLSIRGFRHAILAACEKKRMEISSELSVAMGTTTEEADETFLTGIRAKEIDRDDWYRHIGHKVFRFVDAPVSWFRHTFVDPNRAKNRLPYYHLKMVRGPSIDECPVNDNTCIHMANMQYRLDCQVDNHILLILRDRMDHCMEMAGPRNYYQCSEVIHDHEQADLNFFIKYGELGMHGDAMSCYMKQKHRYIWERRHPEIIEERQKQYKIYKKDMDNGFFNLGFWRAGFWWEDKKGVQSRVGRGHPFKPVDLKDDPPRYKVKAEPDSINR